MEMMLIGRSTWTKSFAKNGGNCARATEETLFPKSGTTIVRESMPLVVTRPPNRLPWCSLVGKG